MDNLDVFIDRAWIEDRLHGRRTIPEQAVPPADLAASCGDHELNAGMEPITPLKPAAVLVPIIDRPRQLSVLFTQRTAHLAHHAGQVSFPGGHIEADDGGPAETALRETEEEVGIDRRHVRLIGHLDTYVTRTGFIVVPVVGIVTPPFTVRPDPHEVAEVFEVPLTFLLDPDNHHRCTASFEGVERHFYAMPYGRHFIWGATAGMVVNLFQILTGRR
jgi:NTP pyrophosphohydrolases including oxidative damage repair enzymes